MLNPPAPLPSPWLVRPLTEADVDSLLHVQTVCYGPDFNESAHVFRQRLQQPFHCSIGVVTADDPRLQAYLVAYWSHRGKVTPLDGVFTAPTDAEQVLYLHDMSVLPTLSGQGVARHLLQCVQHAARLRGLRYACLVSVQGSQRYWERQGFEVQALTDPEQQQHLASYGEGAVYMVAALSS